ncbi:hypothetical protein PT974_04483 [Cladobotryum mycophilum]|uniref:Uncharacterized protein n=1 Tax=Cladobotryum mycophilum TaxID=491253 RepID=A0ABR0SV65_9HYPO
MSSPHDRPATPSRGETGEMTDRTINEDRRTSHRMSQSSKKRASSMAPMGSCRTRPGPGYLETEMTGSGDYVHVDAPKSKTVGPEKSLSSRSDERRSEGSGLLGGLIDGVRKAITSSPNQDYEKDNRYLTRKLEKFELEIRKRDGKLEENEEKRKSLERHHKKELDHLYHQQETKEQAMLRTWEQERAHLKKQNEDTLSELQRTRSEVTKLRQSIAKNESVVTKAHATLVSALAGNVSRSFTDDMVRDELKQFFQGDFFSWCADMCASDIPKPDVARHTLESGGILNRSQFYMQASPHLKFRMDLPDGSSPLVLLQSALAQTLCQVFLFDAYFLAEKSIGSAAGHDPNEKRGELWTFEHAISKASREAAIDWRIQTVESLEKAVPLLEDLFVEKAMTFIENFGFLLKEMGNEDGNDLIRLFFDFAGLALKIWKTRTSIQISCMQSFEKHPFEFGSNYIEADSVAASTMGQRLNGRPIGVITRPLIISQPLEQQADQPPQEVVWLKAVGWLSSVEDPADSPMHGAPLS